MKAGFAKSTMAKLAERIKARLGGTPDLSWPQARHVEALILGTTQEITNSVEHPFDIGPHDLSDRLIATVCVVLQASGVECSIKCCTPNPASPWAGGNVPYCALCVNNILYDRQGRVSRQSIERPLLADLAIFEKVAWLDHQENQHPPLIPSPLGIECAERVLARVQGQWMQESLDGETVEAKGRVSKPRL